MTHRPNKLALLISLIGLGMSAGAQANSVIRVPDASALDVVRWTPGRTWQQAERQSQADPAWPALSLYEGAPLRVDPPAAEPTRDAAATALDADHVDVALPLAAPADTPPRQATPPATEPTPDSVAYAELDADRVDIALPLAAPADAPPRQAAAPATPPPATEPARDDAAYAELDADRVDIALPLAAPADDVPQHQAAPPANTLSATEPTRDDMAHAELDADRIDIALALAAPAQPPQSKPARPLVEPIEIALDIDLTSLACWQQRQFVDGNLPSGVSVAALEQVAARIAERFPAAAPAREYAAPRRAPRLLCCPAREVVVATPAERVLRGLAAVLACDSRNAAEAWSAEAEERVVATQADKVLAALQELSDARRAAAVEDKRRAHRERKRAQQAALQAEAAARAPAAGAPIEDDAALTITAVDIDVGALAALPTPARAPSALGKAVAVADSSLDGLRGGFVGAGLNISFGVERMVFVNGEMVRSTSLHVSELGRISGGSSTSALPLDTSTLALIQTGVGNTVASGTFSPSSLGTVVQNTLDGQNIRNVTVINATVNSLGVLRGLNLQSSMRSAVIDSLRR